MTEPFYSSSSDDDLLPVVDECDKLIGIMPRRQVHLACLRHRAVQVVVISPDGRVWLQKRSAAKDSYPGFWDLSATGHVDPGETYEQAARRELLEELGIDADPTPAGMADACERTGWEFQSMYGLRWEPAVTQFNTTEIEQMRAFTLDEIRELIGGNSPLGRSTPCVVDHLAPILHSMGIDAAVLEQ